MEDKYYLQITEDRDKDRPRSFTYEKDFSRCPGWKDCIENCFKVVQHICNPNLLISTKEKGRYDISIIHGGSDIVQTLLEKLENRTYEHCIECGKLGESRRAYGAPTCLDCHNKTNG